MHEVSIAESLLVTVRQTLADKQFNQVKEIMVEVGELTFISIDALSYAHQVLVEGTEYEGSTLDITEVKGEVSCDSCGYAGPIKRINDERWHTSAPILSCPKCDELVDITKGQDITVTNIRLEVES